MSGFKDSKKLINKLQNNMRKAFIKMYGYDPEGDGMSLKRNVKTNRALPYGAWLERHKGIKWIDLVKYSEEYQKTLEKQYEAYKGDFYE